MELTRTLNLDATPLDAALGAMSYANNIIATPNNIINEPGFKKLITIIDKTIIGMVSVPNGFVVFCKGTTIDTIEYYENNDPDPKKILESTYFHFNVDLPIFGEYTYNYKKDLIISFSEGVTPEANETRIVNINSYGTTQYSTLSANQVELLSLIPTIQYPKLEFEIVKEGSNKIGTYQIAIAYKLQDDTYSNFSILHKAVHVIADTLDDSKPGTSISKSIKIIASAIDSKYAYCKLGIVYKEATAELAYETSDILLTDLNNYLITSVSAMNSIALEAIVLNGISYIKDEAHCSFNANLIRGNVTTIDYTGLDKIGQTIADNCKVDVVWNDLPNPFDNDLSNSKYFREDEMYALYLGVLDYKGSLVNSYPIHHKLDDTTASASNGNAHQIPVYAGASNSELTIVSGYTNTQYDRIVAGTTVDYNAIDFTFNKSNGGTISPGIPLFTDFGNTNLFKGSYITNPLSTESIVKINASFTDNSPDDINYYNAIVYIFQYDILTNTIGGVIDTSTTVYNQNGFTFNYEKTITIANNASIAIFIGLSKSYTESLPTIPDYTPTLIINGTLSMSDGLTTTIVNKPAALLKVTIPSDIITLLGTLSSVIKQCVIFYAEHNTDNSKVLSQAFATRDTHINNINENEYHCPLKSHTKLRLYSFDYLFTKQSISNVDIKSQYKLGGFAGISDRDINEDAPIYTGMHLTKIFGEPKYTDKSITSVTPTAVEYVNLDNSIQNNTASDSFYRPTLTNNQVNILLGGAATRSEASHLIDDVNTDVNYWSHNGWDSPPYNNLEVDSTKGGDSYKTMDTLRYRFALVNIVNRSINLYSNLYNQTLVICSPIINLTPNAVINCTGDTFYGNFTFRMTTPYHTYFYGNSDGVRDGNVFKVIISIAMESRFNIQGRFSGANSYQNVFNIKDRSTSTDSLRKSLFAISYKYDNFINTSEGKGYSSALHENGMAINVYVKELKGISKLINRVIRSNANNSESLTLGWRYYKAKNYKDLPLQRGAIKVLNSTDRYLYIQQEYGLRVASVQDVLNAGSTTSLGSSDLFDREPVEVLYDKFGYISCSNKFGTTLTPLGYVVVDALKAKIFLVNGLEASELTKDKVKDWFVYNVNVLGDNPFINKGLHITYEDIHKRLLFTYKDTITDKAFTISYSFLRGGFVSFHDYNGDYSFYNNLGTYQIKDGSIFKMNHDNKALYFDNVVKESVVQLIWNPQSNINKLLQEVEWQTLINVEGIYGTLYYYDATISKLMIHTDTQCTGLININDNVEWFDASSGTLKAGKWFFNAIDDIVINDYVPFIKGFIDLQNNNLSNSKEWFDISKFITTFAYVTMIYDNYYYDSIDNDWYAANANSITRRQANFVLNNVNLKAIKDNR